MFNDEIEHTIATYESCLWNQNGKSTLNGTKLRTNQEYVCVPMVIKIKFRSITWPQLDFFLPNLNFNEDVVGSYPRVWVGVCGREFMGVKTCQSF